MIRARMNRRWILVGRSRGGLHPKPRQEDWPSSCIGLLVRNALGIALAFTLHVLDVSGTTVNHPATFKDSCGVGEAVCEPWRRAVRLRRQQWLAKAEAARPKLHRRTVIPVRLVKPVADAKAFQGWTVIDNGAVASVLNRQLSSGNEFIFDFGEHIVGYLSFHLMDFGRAVDAPIRLQFAFAEVPAELAENADDTESTISSAWYQRETVTIDDVPSTNSLLRRYAFRYVKVKVVGCSTSGRFGLRSVSATAVTSADETKLVAWTAPSSDLAAIDRIACRTLRDCMQTVFEDGPKRDRRLWLGDLRLQALANYETYRNFDVAKRSLYLLAGTCDDSGLVNSDAYERPFPRSGNCRILDYTALFATTVLEYLEASGDTETARDLWPLCALQLNFVLDPVCADGVFRENGKWWCFIDWQGTLDRQTAEQGTIVYGLKATARLAERLGCTREVAFLSETIGRMERGARAALWSEERGCFVCERDGQVSYLGQAWPVLAGIVDGDTARRCLRAAIADPSAVRPVTPYANHYFTEALYAAGMKKEGDSHLVGYWGRMAAFGADTFWEVFVPDDHRAGPYRTHLMNSYCHAWSCAPSYFLRNSKFKADLLGRQVPRPHQRILQERVLRGEDTDPVCGEGQTLVIRSM